MKLRHLAMLLAGGAVIALLGLTAYATYTWLDLQEHLDEQRRIAEVHEDAARLSQAVDYLALLRRDRLLPAAIHDDAERLQVALTAINDPAIRAASLHLAEIANIATTVADEPMANIDTAPLTTQLRIHESSLMTALEGLLAQRDRELIRLLLRSLIVFVVGAGVFGLLCIAGFTWVRQRLHGPLEVLERGIKALTDGDLTSRIDLHSADELGDLANYLNAMAHQRQQDEQALRASEERFRQLAENITEVFWLTDPHKTTMLYVSPSYESIWGRSCDALYAEPNEWIDAIHPADRARVREAARDQASGGYQQLYRIVRPDGRQRWISDRAFPVRDADGRVHRIAGLAEDVTERVVADRALKERMKELRCLYQVLELTTGSAYPPETVYQRVADLLPASLQHDTTAVARIRIDGRSYYSPRWQEPVAMLESTIRPDGEDAGVVTVGYATPQEDCPDGDGPFLREERALIDGVAAHIGRMLHNRHMAETLEQSQRLESIGQLTGGVAHDFNNLLTVIIGNAELLKEQLDDNARLGDIADMIVGAAQRGAALTHRLLAFARRQPLAPRALDVNQLIASMDTLLRRTLGEHIDIEFSRTGGLWPALVDPAQLENALLNLILNARDAMPTGGRLTIETANIVLSADYAAAYPELQAGEYVMVAVSDTGSGIPQHHIARVFEPFFTTKNAGKGTGLGLSMVYGFVKQSRGQVNIYSEPGQGTTVKMYLPRAPAGERHDEVPTARTDSAGGDETILLVEDDELVRRYAQEQLVDLGYRVLAAADGPTALAVLAAHPDVDLLFTDVVMPGGMTGRQLAETVQREHRHIKVLYTSGYTENAIVHHGRLDPGVRLLSKPYRRAELASSVRRALEASD